VTQEFTYRSARSRGLVAAAAYLNLMKPAAPNVLLTMVAPMHVRLPGGLRRSVRHFGMHLDEPERFLCAVNRSGAGMEDAGRPTGDSFVPR
jgi:hypothetical protein